MTAAAKTGLSVILAILGWFQDGLGRLEQKDYPAAIAAFTKVVEHEATDARLRRRALVCRAASYALTEEMPKAKADLALALGEMRAAEERSVAFGLLTELGADVAALLPKETPQAAFEATRALAVKGELDGVRRRLAGDLAALFDTASKIDACEGGGLGDLVKQVCGELKYTASSLGKGKEVGTAQVRISAFSGQREVTLGLVPVGNEWRVASLVGLKQTQKVADAVAAPAVVAPLAAVAPSVVMVVDQAGRAVSMSDLAANELLARELALQKQISLVIGEYARDHQGNFPEKYADVAALLGEDASKLEFEDPETKERLPRLYHSPGNLAKVSDVQKTMVLATPKALGKRRAVFYVDGHGELVAEQDFLRCAKEQGWNLNAEAQEMSKEELNAKVEALIAQLGDRDSRKRRKAYQELKELGDDASPLLEKHRTHPDPEVRMSIRELLKPKKATAVGVDPFQGGMGGVQFFRD